jgi:hypothetical protein
MEILDAVVAALHLNAGLQPARHRVLVVLFIGRDQEQQTSATVVIPSLRHILVLQDIHVLEQHVMHIRLHHINVLQHILFREQVAGVGQMYTIHAPKVVFFLEPHVLLHRWGK